MIWFVHGEIHLHGQWKLSIIARRAGLPLPLELAALRNHSAAWYARGAEAVGAWSIDMQVGTGHTARLEGLTGEPTHGIHPSRCSGRQVVLFRAEKTPEDSYKKVLFPYSPNIILFNCVRNLPHVFLGSATG